MKKISRLITLILTLALACNLISTTASAAYATVRNGSSGGDVKTLQSMLNTIHCAGLAVDGHFGPATLSAVKNYQSSRGLSVDGIVGPATWASLEKDYKAATSTVTQSSSSNTYSSTVYNNYDYMVITKDNAPLRSSASNKGTVYANLAKGTLVATSGTVKNSAGNLWYRINMNGKSYYMFSGNMKSADAQTTAKLVMVTKNNAPLRATPYDTGSVIQKFASGSILRSVGVYTNKYGNQWYVIKSDSGSGLFFIYSGNLNTKVDTLISYGKDLYTKNQGTYDAWGISQAQALDLAITATSKSEVKAKLYAKLQQCLDNAVGKTMDVSSYNTNTYYSYYDYSGIYRNTWGLYTRYDGCTWYAFNRYKQLSGSQLMFQGAGGGNAQDWNDRIMTSQFKKLAPSALTDGIMNAVAVDDQGSPINGVYYGHVVHIEAVFSGNVYFSEGWYSGGRFHSRLVKTSISNFSNVYETVIVAK